MIQKISCGLCEQDRNEQDGSEVIYRNQQLRVVLVDDANYPGFCRVIWQQHIAEMTDLPIVDRSTLMRTVCQVEAAQREVLQPLKINLAALGNMVPHMHWHVIPRYADDAHFPHPVWATPVRQTDEKVLQQRRGLLPALRAAVIRHVSCNG